MISFDFNGETRQLSSIEELRALLLLAENSAMFELWAVAPGGESLCMLRNRDNALLMYLRQNGDSGLSSRSAVHREGFASFRLSNGQHDEYPLSWCIDTRSCYDGFLFFFDSSGELPHSISWLESLNSPTILRD